MIKSFFSEHIYILPVSLLFKAKIVYPTDSPTVQWQWADRKDKTFFVCGGKYLPADSPQKLRLFVLFVPLGDHVIKSRKLVEAELIVDHHKRCQSNIAVVFWSTPHIRWSRIWHK